MIIDTCSWLKIQAIQQANIFDLREFLYESDLWTTHQLLKEYEHYLHDFLDISRFSIQVVKIESLTTFTEKELDDADLSIIELGRKNQAITILSDDGAELSVMRAFHIRSFQLSEFILFLVEKDFLRKREANRAIIMLRKMENIRERKKKQLLSAIDIA
jgi:hypothetical protein